MARWRQRHGEEPPSVDGQSTYVCVMLLARAIRRAGTTEVGAVRRAAANHRYQSPQGPVWIDPENNHCHLTPRLARAVEGCQFDIFWEAEAPQRPDPYLSNLDLSAIGATLEAREPGGGRMQHLRVVK